MEFADGVAHHVDPKDRSIYETIQFVRYKVRVDLSRAAGPASAEETYLEKDMWELAEHVRHLRAKGDSYDARRAWVEFHRRFAMPFVCLAFGLIGLPLGVSPPRTGRSRGFTTSIGVLCMFYLLFRAGENLGWKGVLHPIVAMWTPIALLLALGGYLLVKKAGERPIWALDLAFELAGRAAEWLRARLGWSKPEDTQHP
jgi:lipopolysaccharide export system permease protein